MPRQLTSDGPLLGAVEDAEFEPASIQLEPGDTVLLHTDGLDALLLSQDGRRVHDDVTETDWYKRLGTKPVTEHLGDVAQRLATAAPTEWPVDDVTLLVLEVR